MTTRSGAQELAQVAELLTVRTGLDFSGGRGRWLGHFLARTSRDPRWYVENADADTFARLCDAATIQESYFFREPATLDLVRHRAFPELERCSGDIRVWSAGCAAGEEARTVGMMMFDAGLADRARVLGTDLSPGAVQAARSGRYGRWSLRGVDEQTARARFRREGAAFRVVTERCAQTTFTRHNLLSDNPPTGGPFHLVLCRNVLMYLTPQARQHVARLLTRALAPGGWLVTGVSDPPVQDMIGLEPVVGSWGTAYRRAASPRAALALENAPVLNTAAVAEPVVDQVDQVVGAGRCDRLGHRPAGSRPAASPTGGRTAPTLGGSRAATLPPDWQARGERALLRAEPDDCAELARAALTVLGDSVAAHSLLVRALAAGGHGDEAVTAVQRAVAAVGDDSELRSLHAMLLLEDHRCDEARAVARQAVYLDPDNALAHLTLARAAHLLGDDRTAVRSARSGRRTLQRRDRNA